MTEEKALNLAQGSAWRLLLRYTAANGLASEHQALAQVTEALVGLGLHPTEEGRIGRAVTEALQKAAKRSSQDEHEWPVTIRVWTAETSREVPLRSGADTDEAGSQKGRGWGFYLVQGKEDHRQTSAGEPHHLVELYLYQEKAFREYKTFVKKVLKMEEIQEVCASPASD
jgi:hypothetical protein